MPRRYLIGLCGSLLLILSIIPQMAKAQRTWYANAGVESRDKARQGQAFLPNEMWILAGDSIQWTFAPQNEPHTVTFLRHGQPVPVFQGGPPPIGCASFGSATQPSGSSFYDGLGSISAFTCVNSGPLAGGATYSVTFPRPGNYELICLIHLNMNGVVHVLDQGPLPYLQFDYDRQARDEAHDLLDANDNPREEQKDFRRSANEVIMTGDIVATGGGRQYLAIDRFFPGTIRVHTGDTVEWTNLDPTEPHTVTFGTEPLNPTTLVGVGGSPDPDGAWHAVIPDSITTTAPGYLVAPGSPPVFACFVTPCSNTVNSGFLQAAPENAVGRAGAAPGTTRIRVTFTKPGTYNYICALHDENGMVGKVIVEGWGGHDDDRDRH